MEIARLAEYNICLLAGTQTVWHSLVKIPNVALNAATGIPESTWKELKTYPLVPPLHLCKITHSLNPSIAAVTPVCMKSFLVYSVIIWHHYALSPVIAIRVCGIPTSVPNQMSTDQASKPNCVLWRLNLTYACQCGKLLIYIIFLESFGHRN